MKKIIFSFLFIFLANAVEAFPETKHFSCKNDYVSSLKIEQSMTYTPAAVVSALVGAPLVVPVVLGVEGVRGIAENMGAFGNGTNWYSEKISRKKTLEQHSSRLLWTKFPKVFKDYLHYSRDVELTERYPLVVLPVFKNSVHALRVLILSEYLVIEDRYPTTEDSLNVADTIYLHSVYLRKKGQYQALKKEYRGLFPARWFKLYESDQDRLNDILKNQLQSAKSNSVENFHHFAEEVERISIDKNRSSLLFSSPLAQYFRKVGRKGRVWLENGKKDGRHFWKFIDSYARYYLSFSEVSRKSFPELSLFSVASVGLFTNQADTEALFCRRNFSKDKKIRPVTQLKKMAKIALSNEFH